MFKGTPLYSTEDPIQTHTHTHGLRAPQSLLILWAHVNLTLTTLITRQKQSISDIGRVGESGITQTLSANANNNGDFLREDD